jgi:hypothetical protein
MSPLALFSGHDREILDALLGQGKPPARDTTDDLSWLLWRRYQAVALALERRRRKRKVVIPPFMAREPGLDPVQKRLLSDIHEQEGQADREPKACRQSDVGFAVEYDLPEVQVGGLIYGLFWRGYLQMRFDDEERLLWLVKTRFQNQEKPREQSRHLVPPEFSSLELPSHWPGQEQDNDAFS